LLAFAGIGASILTGVSPLKHRIWTEFSYDPERSPFKWTERISMLTKMIDAATTRLDGKGQRAKTAVAHVTYKVSNRVSHRTYTPIAHGIPLSMLHLFNVTIRHDIFHEGCLPISNIPDVLHKRQIAFRVLSQSKMRDSQIFREALRLDRNVRVIFLQLRELDRVGHLAGPRSDRIRQSLLNIDDIVHKIVEEYQKFFQLDIFIFSDHGMVEVNRTVDLLRHLKKADLKEGHDYIIFLDSTFARFWTFDEKIKERITTLVGKAEGGRVLTEEDFERYQIPAEKENGDIIWLADPGTLILPNYYQGSNPNLGMHGYAPEVEEQNSPFIICSNDVDARKIEYEATPMDLFATILDLLHSPIPPETEGRSLLTAQ